MPSGRAARHQRKNALGRRARAPVNEVGASVQSVPVDLLVFGPHPDDLEIGLGGTVARHAAARHAGGPVRSDGRRDGQQRHGRGAAGGGGSRAPRARRRVAREPALARSADRQGSRAPRAGGGVHPPSSAAHGRDPVLVGSSSGSRRGERAAHRSGLQRRAAALRSVEGEAWKPEWICYYFINDSADAVVRGRRVRDSTIRNGGARLPRQPVSAPPTAARWPRV